MLMLLIMCLLVGQLWGGVFAFLMSLAGYAMDVPDAMLSGLLFAALFFPCLLWISRSSRRKMERAMAKLPSPSTHNFLVVMPQEGKSRSMIAALCEDSLCLIGIEQKELPVTVYKAEEINRAVLTENVLLEIHLTEDRVLPLRSRAAASMLEALKERGWLPFQH